MMSTSATISVFPWYRSDFFSLRIQHKHTLGLALSINLSFFVQVNNGVVNVEVSGLRVPTSGGRLDRDLWKSRMSKFYYGCSNASKKFQEAEAITQSKRYLLIATSGGLNQQRTGRRTPYGFGYFLK
ncbi:O-fucosyltransferase family protein [Actinidia rufa]|uniref:O-fucosyltransferase family protein n=1 Tax=Actinidia rufa TaxID=165716 RepID=A0A7J0E0N9_9ERIC|nr:O-fucosyltransferase family protein [Actinidia rufa]